MVKQLILFSPSTETPDPKNEQVKELENLPDVLKRHYTDEALEEYPIYVFKPLETPDDLLAFDLETGTFVPYEEYTKEHAIAFISASKQAHWYLRLPNQLGKEWSWCIGHHWRGRYKGHPGDNPWHYMYQGGQDPNQTFRRRSAHPNELAGDLHRRLGLKESLGNGRGPEFDVHDDYMQQGLVKVLDTGETVELPDRFNCYRCIDDIDWRRIDRYHSYLYSALTKASIEQNQIHRMMDKMGLGDALVPITTYSPEIITRIAELTDEQLDQMEKELLQRELES